uniref:Metalloendopeptidase n=1 Tax=Parastrongyloides trichosuri TaxID=131310 RepID=A0A0N5A618_PARTI
MGSFFNVSIRKTHGGIIKDFNRNWTFPIKVYMDYWTAYYELQYALYLIEAHTCINFSIVNSYNEIKDQHGIYFKYNGRSSSCKIDTIGRNIKNTPNVIFISYLCYRNSLRILPLIFLTLGITPEYDRFDRDSYVEIKKENMHDYDYINFFKKNETDSAETYNTSYDYGSIVHDSLKAFSKNGEETIVVKGNFSQYYKKMVGQKEILSFNEFKVLNLYYCSQRCSKQNRTTCLNSGYPDPKFCNHCKCPYPFIGNQCERLENSSSRCPIKNIISTNSSEQTLSLNNSYYCYITIKAPEGKRNQIKVIELKFPDYSICARGTNNVEIIYKADRGVMGICICGSITQNFTIESENYLAFIIYYSSDASNSFKFSVQAIPSISSNQIVIAKPR